MAADTWMDIIPNAIKAPYIIYKNWADIVHWYKKAQAFTGTGKPDIVVLGVPASGKSVLTSFVYGEINNLNYDLPDASLTVEGKAISLGAWTHLFRVIPGQSYAARYEGLRKAIEENKKLNGVVYVVNYGYTEVRDATNRALLIGRDGVDTVERLRQYNLERELRDFTTLVDKLIEHHSVANCPKWLYIVCAKADLFLEDLNEAQQYYNVNGDSPFSKQLQRLHNNIGKTRFRIGSAPISSYQKSLEWNEAVVLSKIHETDDVNALLKNLVDNLAKLSNNG